MAVEQRTIPLPAPAASMADLKRAIDAVFGTMALGGTNLRLKPYQCKGVVELTRKLRTCGGALLGDVMGLGKTLQGLLAALAAVALDCLDARRRVQLVLDDHDDADAMADVVQECLTNCPVPKPILLVVPTSAVGAWQKELQRLLPGCLRRRNKMALTATHGPFDDMVALKEGHLANPRTRIAIITPGKLKKQCERGAASPWFATKWSTVVVDEAHQLLHDSQKAFRAIAKLKQDDGIHLGFLLLSGTPLNTSHPGRSLAAILELMPEVAVAMGTAARDTTLPERLMTDAYWREALKCADGHAQANAVWDHVLVRRTHDDIQDDAEVRVLDDADQADLAAGLVNDNDGAGCAADAMPTVPDATELKLAVEPEAAQEYGQHTDRLQAVLAKLLRLMRIPNPTPDQRQQMTRMLHCALGLLHKAQQALMWGDHAHSYLEGLAEAVAADVAAGRGVFVTCFWKLPLVRLRDMLVASGAVTLDQVALVDGSMSATGRVGTSQAVQEGRLRVVLMTSGCAVGMTLIQLKSVYVVGSCLDLAVERQAIARVAGRLGQTADVTIQLALPRVNGARTLCHAIRKCHAARGVREAGLLDRGRAGVQALAAAGDENLAKNEALLTTVSEFLATN